MWLLFRALCFLVGLTRFSFRLGKTPVYDKTTPKGIRYRLDVKRHKGNIASYTLTIEAPDLPYFRIQKENWLSKSVKALGLAREMQMGDREVDDALFIGTDNHSLTLFLRTRPEILRTILALYGRGWKEVRSRHFSKELVFKGTREADVSEVSIGQIEELVAMFSKAPAQIKTIDSFEFKVLIFESIAFGFLSYTIGAYLEFIFIDAIRVLDPWTLAVKGLAIGAAIFALWIFLASMILKQSSRLVPLLSDTLLMFLFCSIVSGPQLMTDLNKGLDRSPVDPVRSDFTKGNEENRARKKPPNQSLFYFGLRKQPLSLAKAHASDGLGLHLFSRESGG